MQNKKNIAVIFGGKSAEHDVSIITAHTPIMDSLSLLPEYNIVPVYISKEGVWYSKPEMTKMDFFKEKNYEKTLTYKDEISLNFNRGLEFKGNGFFAKATKIDLVFPAMHGTYGEDGSMAGLLRMANVPFVGCDVFSSAVAMDKVLTKQVLSSEGLPVTKYIWFTNSDWFEKGSKILEEAKKLTYPLFVKPVHLGSSIGITKVKNETELENAIEVAVFYDTKVLVEEGVHNLVEVTLPIIGNSSPEFANIEKPLNKADFFDFQDKYIGSGGKKGGDGVNQNYSEIPAKISEELKNKVLEYGRQTYSVLGSTGISRVDFLIDSVTNQVFVNEVNPLPGSLYAHNFKQSGVTSVELVKKLIYLAEERFEEQQKLTYTFKSKILDVVGGSKI